MTILKAGSALTFLIVAAGCSVAPAPVSESRPAGRDVLLALDVSAVDGRVPANATLESLLRRHELSAEFTASVVEAMRGVFNPREIRADQAYRLTKSLDGLFREFRYQIDT
ncbi:MAG TPA: hypothetical protein VF424_07675, partial [Vicinamibacterales bacterium]